MVYGHAAQSEPYNKSVLKVFQAVGERGELKGKPSFQDGTFFLKLPAARAYLARVDDGPWAKTTRGWKRGSRSRHKGVLRVTQELFYAKLIRGTDRAYGLPLEIVLVSEPSEKVLRGKVLFKGKPARNVPIEIEHKAVARTGTDGTFEMKSRDDDPLILRASYKEVFENNPEIDSASHVCTLTVQP